MREKVRIGGHLSMNLCHAQTIDNQKHNNPLKFTFDQTLQCNSSPTHPTKKHWDEICNERAVFIVIIGMVLIYSLYIVLSLSMVLLFF